LKRKQERRRELGQKPAVLMAAQALTPAAAEQQAAEAEDWTMAKASGPGEKHRTREGLCWNSEELKNPGKAQAEAVLLDQREETAAKHLAGLAYQRAEEGYYLTLV
jgi:hypothetical protein